MHWAERFQVGPALEEAIRRDVAELTTKHPAGIAVRLHVLGDFHSPAYVRLWAELMRKHVTLRVFGFSRRWDDGDPIAEALRELLQEQPERFRIRLSNAPPELGPSTVSIEYEAPPGQSSVQPRRIRPGPVRRVPFAGQQQSRSPSFSIERREVEGAHGRSDGNIANEPRRNVNNLGQDVWQRSSRRFT